MRLFPKLLLSFLTVAAVGVGVVAWAANQAATREVRGFMVQGGMVTEAGLVQELAAFYQGRGAWDGVEAVLNDARHGGAGMMMGQQILVADAAGRVVADTAGQRLGETLAAEVLGAGQPIVAQGRQVGTLLARAGMGAGRLDGPAQTAADLVVARVNRSIWLAAVAAGAAAVVIGGALAYGLVRPMRRLTAATGAIARGDLTQRVAVSARDEIGDLAASFNAMAADLQKAERLRREMVADIAHELRNPLAVLRGSLEAVTDGVLPPTAENLQPLLDQTQLLSRLVDDLRTLALADAGQLALQCQPVSPAEVARASVAQFAPQAAARPVTLSLELAPDLPATVALDRERIGQVLGNLLANALRHTPEGGRVTVACAPAGAAGGVQFTVADTGAGIPPEALAHIFERFYRADRGRARSDGGTGLGLAIARQLVEAHGGQIWAESAPGAGTRVAFSLPGG